MHFTSKKHNIEENLDDSHQFYVEAVADRVKSYGMGLLAAVVFLRMDRLQHIDFEGTWAVALWMAGMVLIMDLLQYVVAGQVVYMLRERLHDKTISAETAQKKFEGLQGKVRKFYYAKIVFLIISTAYVAWLSL